MSDSWQLTTTHTVDLGYEQMLILEGMPGTRFRVIFRGVWLGRRNQPRSYWPSSTANF
jgi:hypothetical protein